MADGEHPRLVLNNFLSIEECKELQFIHRSCSTVGYRPNVFSTTLSHLIATNSAHFIMPFVPIRERLKEKLEEFFGCEYELVTEFTGLISWTRGASIGWHSDDNRPYLKQRDFTAVCYLNNYGKDFEGGLFKFQDGEPNTIAPMTGDVVMYTADSRNIHSVDEVKNGERLTLTLWFSRDSSHDEDVKLISLLSQNLPNSSDNLPHLCVPIPASSNMYWFITNQDSGHEGFDIRWARLHVLGYNIYSPQNMSNLSEFSELMTEPLQLARGDELFFHEFLNILDALQVVQFFHWKASEYQTSQDKPETGKVIHLSQSQWEKVSGLKLVFLKDHQLAETVFNNYIGLDKTEQHFFYWAEFSAALTAFRDYIGKLHKEILISLPYWRNNQSIFSIPCDT